MAIIQDDQNEEKNNNIPELQGSAPSAQVQQPAAGATPGQPATSQPSRSGAFQDLSKFQTANKAKIQALKNAAKKDLTYGAESGLDDATMAFRNAARNIQSDTAYTQGGNLRDVNAEDYYGDVRKGLESAESAVERMRGATNIQGLKNVLKPGLSAQSALGTAALLQLDPNFSKSLQTYADQYGQRLEAGKNTYGLDNLSRVEAQAEAQAREEQEKYNRLKADAERRMAAALSRISNRTNQVKAQPKSITPGATNKLNDLSKFQDSPNIDQFTSPTGTGSIFDARGASTPKKKTEPVYNPYGIEI